MTTTKARTVRTARPAPLAPLAAAYVAANAALEAAMVRLDQLAAAGVPAKSPAAVKAVAAWDAAYAGLEAARDAYEWDCDFAGTTCADFNEPAYALEFYAPDWALPAAYARLSRG